MRIKIKDITIRLELLLFSVIAFSAVVFSVEPAKNLYVEHTLATSTDSLSKFQSLNQKLYHGVLSKSELSNVIIGLEELKESRFILQDDCTILIGESYLRLGDTARAQETYETVLQTSSDSIAKTDALLKLSEIYNSRGLYKKSIELLENNKHQLGDYRKAEAYFILAKLYYLINNIKKSGEYMIYAANLTDTIDRGLYKKVIKKNWKSYSFDQKKMALESLLAMKQNGDYLEMAKKLVKDHSPNPKELEAIAYNIIYQGNTKEIGDFLKFLASKPQYREMTQTLTDFWKMAKPSIQSENAKVRGSYCNRLLKSANAGGRYNSGAALSYFNSYLDGEVEPKFLRQNLILTIRSLIATKQFNDIIDIVERSYDKMSYPKDTTSIGEGVNFWAGYAYYQIGDFKNALRHFESSISRLPNGYYAMHAKGFIQDMYVMVDGSVFGEYGNNLNDYLWKLENRFNNANDALTKLYYGKILYAFKTGVQKDHINAKITELKKQTSGNELLNLDSETLTKLTTSKVYLNFIVYSRLGFTQKSKAILSSVGITDKTVQNILLMREAIKNNDFRTLGSIIGTIEATSTVRENIIYFAKEVRKAFYPLPYEKEVEFALNNIKDNRLDKYLTYSIIRGESLYQPRALSRVGAQGLMQLMPSTARGIAPRVLGQSEVDLTNPQNNIALGTAFLNDNVRAYGLLEAVAAYNGGYAVIQRMKRTYNPNNAIELMEIHPYQETRDYVRKILTFYQLYLDLYQNTDISTMAFRFYSPKGS